MKNELTLSLREESVSFVKKFLPSLEGSNITHIGYREFYKDGSSKAFCSNISWYGIDIELEMKIHYLKEIMFLKENNFNYVIRTQNNISNNFLKALNFYGMCNSLILYKKDRDVLRQFSFIAAHENTNAINTFINHTKDFLKLSDVLTPELSRIFHKISYKELNKPLVGQNVLCNMLHKDDKDKDLQLLTIREKECLSHLATGVSIKSIATNLDISTKTAEYHIQNIRKKLKANSKSQARETYRFINK